MKGSWGPWSKYCIQLWAGLHCDTGGEMENGRLFPLFEAKIKNTMPFKYPLNISLLLSWQPKAFLESHWTQAGREHHRAHGHSGCFLFLGIAPTHGLEPEDAIYQKAIYSPCWKSYFPKLLIPPSFLACLHLTSLNIWYVSWEEKSLSSPSHSLHVKNTEQFPAQFIFLAQSRMIIQFSSARDGRRSR